MIRAAVTSKHMQDKMGFGKALREKRDSTIYLWLWRSRMGILFITLGIDDLPNLDLVSKMIILDIYNVSFFFFFPVPLCCHGLASGLGGGGGSRQPPGQCSRSSAVGTCEPDQIP